MKKSDIRKGTYIIMLFVAVSFFVILTVGKRDEKEFPAVVAEEDTIPWSDTLTNASSSYTPLATMDGDIQRFMDKWRIAGISFAMTRNDSLLYAKGYGWADREQGVKMTPGSVMRIASASKLITAAAIMKLQEDGKLSLDSKVFGPEGILSDTAYTNKIRDTRIFEITVDHLLQHKGGFTLAAGDPMLNTADLMQVKHLDSVPDNEELTEIVLGRRIGFTPGSRRRYSNFGYMLLSLVIERITGKSYWDYVTDNILIPAGAYKFRPATNYYEERYPDEVKYYGPDDDKVPEFNGSGRMVDLVYGGRNINGLVGAGGWVTSAADLARFVASIDKDNRLKDILAEESVDLMTEMDDNEKFARGWSEVNENGKWERTGTLSSSHTYIVRYGEGDTWIMITNTGVWTGYHFSHDMAKLVNTLRQKYSSNFPSRNLW